MAMIDKIEVYRAKPQGFLPIVEVSACYVEFNNKLLFLKRSIGNSQENTWGIPAGKIERGETARQAVNRETLEETGFLLEKNKLYDVGKLFVRYPDVDFVFHMFHQELSDLPAIHLSDEHQDYRWVTRQEALQMPLISGAAEALHHFQALSKKPKLLRKDFYFIRHGETDVNAYPDIKRMDYDLPLNAKGRLQASLARNSIMKLPLNSVCFSPIQRARETKDILVNDLEIDHIEINDLSECKAVLWTKMVGLEEANGYHVCQHVDDFLSRVAQGINSALKQDGPSLIVAHGGVHWAMCYHMMIENHPWKIGNCELIHFRPIGDIDWEAEILY